MSCVHTDSKQPTILQEDMCILLKAAGCCRQHVDVKFMWDAFVLDSQVVRL